MKKVLTELIITFVLSLTCLQVNAQISYVGGSFRFSVSDSHSMKTGPLQNMVDFSVAPDFGWDLKDNLAVGLRPTFGFSRVTTGDQEIRSINVGINPYVRYRMADFRRFGLWAEADAETRFSQEWSLNRNETISKSQTTSIGIQLLPVVTCQLNSHIALETRLNIFSLGMTGARIAYNDNTEASSFNFGLRATSKDIIGDLGDITIGFLYRF